MKELKVSWPVLILLAITLAAFSGLVVMVLWNMIMVKLFSLPTLTWIDATVLWLLVRVFLTQPKAVQVRSKTGEFDDTTDRRVL